MIAAIPYYQAVLVPDGVHVALGSWQATLPTFGIPVDPWTMLVCFGILAGMEVSRARALRMGFEPRDIVDGAVFTVLSGFLMAHIFTVLFYFPERLKTDGIWALLRVWQGFASTGGWIGAFLGLFVFYRWIRPMPVGRMADLIAYGFPVGWLFGRLGCASVHDHIGRETTLPIGVWFPAGHWAATPTHGVLRFELGLYEAIWTIPVLIFFLWLGKKDQAPGTFFGWFFTLYAPARFILDQLRNTDLAYSDARYFGLTPAQYSTFLLFAFGVWLLWRRDPDFKPWPLDGLPDQAERALAPAGSDA